jgi:PTH1 family peptidyl-tRNA hydrolase
VLLVVGLGNPGREHAGQRHNVGFLVVDALRETWGLPELKSKWNALWTRGDVGGRPVALLEPQTYMNLSGESVQPAAAFLKVEKNAILVVHDELDLPWGQVRLKVGGGHAGHNGLRSIMQCLGTPDFLRCRVGIGRPPPDFRGDIAAWVLSGFDPVQKAELPGVVTKAADGVSRVLNDGIDAAMRAVHAPVPAPTDATGRRPADG